MATYRDPVRVFAPLEVVERLLEIREEAGYSPEIFLRSSDDLAAYFDAYGFDVLRFYRTGSRVSLRSLSCRARPRRDHAHTSPTAH